MRFFYTLKFQIGLALFFLVLALAGAVFVSQYMLEELLNTEKIIQLGGKLQKSSQQMSMHVWSLSNRNDAASVPGALTVGQPDSPRIVLGLTTAARSCRPQRTTLPIRAPDGTPPRPPVRARRDRIGYAVDGLMVPAAPHHPCRG